MNDFLNMQLDRYELRERIGSGGMARVFKAWDTTLDRMVAVKVLYEHLAEDPSFKERFAREAKFIASINHPNIVQVYDYNVIERNGQTLCYMVMSYIPGKTLRQIMEERLMNGQPIDPKWALRVVRDVAEALGYAHEKGMAHRDVKPSNILLNEKGDAVLTDFGIARLVQSARLTQDGVSTGTPTYMSPEQASGEPGDHRSDLYSLAVIVFEMLAGKPPFDDESGLSVMLKHINAPVPQLSSVTGRSSPQIDRFLSRALDKEPEARYQTAQEFIKALEDALQADSSANQSTPEEQLTTSVSSQLPKEELTAFPSAVSQTQSRRLRVDTRTSTGLIVLITVVTVALLIALISARLPQGSASLEVEDALTSQLYEGNPFFTSSFRANNLTTASWPQGQDALVARIILPEGIYRLSNRRPQSAQTSIFNSEEHYGSVSITMDAVLLPDSARASAYGIVFRYQDEDNYNVFAVDGLGRYSIWVRAGGVWRELREAETTWTPNTAVNEIGARNRLTIDIIGNGLTGYINNRRVFRLSDDTLPDGRIGIYFAADDGEMTVDVSRFQVYPSVPSMTGP
ncbi:MAG: serine/threonine-protein kinase [Aggregatilineales bacterium]